MFKTCSVRIQGVSPLIQHNGRLSNPLDAVVKAIKAVSSKRPKTDADIEELSRLEWYGGLYLTDGVPCLPGETLEAHLIDCAKKNRRASQAKAGLFCDGDFPLQYDGPQDIDALWQDEAFRLVVAARVQKNRVLRTRPIFRDWACAFTVTYNDKLLDEADIRSMLEVGGEQIGLCDWRPRFGRYVVEKVTT